MVDILAADYSPVALLQAVFVLESAEVVPLHEAVTLISQNVEDAGIALEEALPVYRAVSND